jgi:predicted TPR repeat methyltransferase
MQENIIDPPASPAQGDPEFTPEELLKLAICLHQEGARSAAEEIYDILLEAFPEWPEPLHFYGVLKHQQGDDGAAVELIEKAIALAPHYADAHNNLGNIHNKAGKAERSAECYRRALALNPDNISARNNLGLALKDLGRFDEAVLEFRRAIELMPDNAEFHHNLGNVLTKLCRFKDAAAAYQRSIELRPYRSSEYENLCRKLYLLRAFDDGLRVVHQWLEHDPANPLALHRLAAFTGENVPERASAEYVRLTFDGFADSFDLVLKGLEYRAPDLAGAALSNVAGVAEAKLDVLDAGCGTGLCASHLKPYARSLVGVDLSARMLERARARNLYDKLVQRELTEYMSRRREAFDAIVSADTLVYFGDLAPVFQAVAGALRPAGWLVFTVEKAEQAQADAGYRINPHGRYSHTAGYIGRALGAAGLEIHCRDAAILRYEGGLPVEGLVVTARKPG